MKSFKQFITENVTKNHYWLALNIHHDPERHSEVVDQLKKGELHGVKGISNDKRIVNQWFHTGRNALLVMPHDEVHKLNPNIRPIEYQNPHSMMKNGMHDLHRILQKSPDSKHGTSQLMGQMFDHGIRHAMKEIPNHVGYGLRDGARNRGTDLHEAMTRANGGKFPEIHSPQDFEHHLHKALEHDEQIEKDYNDEKTETKPLFGGAFKSGMRNEIRDVMKHSGGAAKFIEHASNSIGKTYQDEGEHAVDAPSFKVPKNSKLIALTHHSDIDKIKNAPMTQAVGMSDYDKKRVGELDTFHNSLKELGDHYKVKEIENSHYEKNRMYGKRSKFKLKKD